MSPYSLPIRRPVATVMVFAGILALGLVAWRRIPVELMPPLGGNELYVDFARPGSEPAVVEREILLRLEARVEEFPDVLDTRAEVRDFSGQLSITFAPGTNLKVRELDLRRAAAEIQRTQPKGTFVGVSSQDLSALSRFVMFVQVVGLEDRNTLLDFVRARVEPRLRAVAGVSRVFSGGGAPQEMMVRIDPERCAAMGILPEQVVLALRRAVRTTVFLGGIEDDAGRTAVVLDGRPEGADSLGDLRITSELPVQLRHVADIGMGAGREQIYFRVNGQPTVAFIVFQEEGANLIRLGRALRDRIDDLREEFRPLGIDFVVNFDSAAKVEDELDRLKSLALTGFLIALAVLFLYLRQWRAVAVVGVAVPTSLLAAIALLFVTGQSINLLTLFGLAVGIGMLVDNSIVVYEAVQRQMEHGADPDLAVEAGLRRTLRAILASSLCNAIVFLPILFTEFEQEILRKLLGVLALAIILPMLGSVLAAVGLVPLLARRLAAPAAIAVIEERERRREEQGGLPAPDRVRELFGAVLTLALRRPGGWITVVAVAVLLTATMAVPWIAVSTVTEEAPQAESVRFSVTTESGSSLQQASSAFARLEDSVLQVEGVNRVESVLRATGGTLTIHLDSGKEEAGAVSAGRIRGIVREAADEIGSLEVSSASSSLGGGGPRSRGTLASLLGQGPARIVLSGPDSRGLGRLATDVEERLRSVDEIGQTTIEGGTGQYEMRVSPDQTALSSLGLTADQVLPALNVLRREGVELRTGFTLADGREIPLVVRRGGARAESGDDLERLRLATPVGALPISALAEVRRMPPPPLIQHRNGRRELSVTYLLDEKAPRTGPARQALERRIREAIQQVRRPAGYAVEAPGADAPFSWFRRILVPILLLLYGVLAVTFESMTLPLLVLLALPLTVLGATWALVLAGMPAGVMALVGGVALIGLTINPAILLVDRMQQRARVGGLSPGAAALSAVRERSRPILMTVSTAVAGLWPLALTTGRENEIWPPFATVVMGGLVTSTLLTLLVIPVGFVFLHRLDRIFGRLGPWIVIGWIAATSAIVTPLVASGVVTSLTWEAMTTLLVAGVLLLLAVAILRPRESPLPASGSGPPVVEVRYLHKIYNNPGPIGRAWRAPQRFARRVLAVGGRAFHPRDALDRLVPIALVFAGAAYLATFLQSIAWRMVFMFAGSALVIFFLGEARRARGRADATGQVAPGGPEGFLIFLAPWAALAWAVREFVLLPRLHPGAPRLGTWVPVVLAILLAIGQLGRRTARRIASGALPEQLLTGRLRPLRTVWRRLCRSIFGLDLPRDQVHAVAGVHLSAAGGMVGILGPNGAGKTTLLRLMSGILDPTLGNVTLGGVPVRRLRRHLARSIGFLPQDFGLPSDLTAREYLDYYALLYEIGPAECRRERIDGLLGEVGLGDRADEPIGGYSGGMRQRVAVARTLLRLPPVIIVDEPTVGLDPTERIRFRNLLARLARGRIVFFSTHVAEDVEVACDRVVVMARGRVVYDGPTSDLAALAEGRVWVASLEAGEEPRLESGARVVDVLPQASGRVQTRILSERCPHPEAAPEKPTLQDGYLWLTGPAGSVA